MTSLAFSTATSAPVAPDEALGPPRFLRPVACGPRASSSSDRSRSISSRASLSFSESVPEVASDCSSEAFVGETPVFSTPAAVREGSLGSLTLVGVEVSLVSLAGARPTTGGATVVAEGGVTLRSLTGVAVVGLEWAGAKIPCIGQRWFTAKGSPEQMRLEGQTLGFGLYGSPSTSQ